MFAFAFARGPCGARLATETHALVLPRTDRAAPQNPWKACVGLQTNGTANVFTVLGAGVCSTWNAKLKTQNLQICQATLTCNEYLADLKTRFCPVGRPALPLAEPML